MVKFLCRCGYCGTKWVDVEEYTWRLNSRKCTKCGETKNIDVVQVVESPKDVFGYRFSKPFEAKPEVQYGTHQD